MFLGLSLKEELFVCTNFFPIRNREKQGGTDGPRDFDYYTDCSKKKYTYFNKEKNTHT
jgi:hypothetical protein